MASTISEEANRIPLDFSSVQSLPESHAWSNGSSGGAAGLGSIPVVDLMDPNAVEAIGLACENWGVFELKNHGIPLSLIEEVEVETKRLFGLPTEQKLKALRPSGGGTGYGRAVISPFFPKFMWHEGFTIMGSPSEDATKIWPHDHARFCEVMEKCQKEMKIVAEQVTQKMLKFVGISEEGKKWVGSSECLGALQLNSYPRCPDPDRAMGLAPHTDTSLFTMINQTEINGLQIFKEGMGWVEVQPQAGDLVVLAADLLHIISNARFPSVLHRVTVNRSRQRYSFAYFYGPPRDHVLSPFHSHPRFRAVTVKEYTALKAKDPQTALPSISI